MSDELRFERIIDAPPEVVFDAFTSPAGQNAFYGRDDTGWTVHSECDLRVGGVWTITFGSPRVGSNQHRHRFEVIDRPRRLVLATTEIRADGSSLTFTTEFAFLDRTGQTLMVMTQTGLPPELGDEHQRGLPDAFARLRHVVRRRSPTAASPPA